MWRSRKSCNRSQEVKFTFCTCSNFGQSFLRPRFNCAHSLTHLRGWKILARKILESGLKWGIANRIIYTEVLVTKPLKRRCFPKKTYALWGEVVLNARCCSFSTVLSGTSRILMPLKTVFVFHRSPKLASPARCLLTQTKKGRHLPGR